MSETKYDSVFSITSKILNRMGKELGTSAGKATMATLRNSIGRETSQTIAVWPILFDYIPETFLSKTGDLSNSEQAILTSLQMYALHQQGRENSVDKWAEKKEWNNIGAALKSLRTGEDTTAIDRRFNAMITATTFEELVQHLRQMIRLLRRNKEVTLSYASLANDLYAYLQGKEEAIRIQWAKAYYSRSVENKSENKEGENQND